MSDDRREESHPLGRWQWAAEIVRTIVQEFPLALYGSMLVGVICAFLGVYIVARRVVFLGAVMTQVSVMGTR